MGPNFKKGDHVEYKTDCVINYGDPIIWGTGEHIWIQCVVDHVTEKGVCFCTLFTGVKRTFQEKELRINKQYILNKLVERYGSK
jgi:hypothetical protein